MKIRRKVKEVMQFYISIFISYLARIRMRVINDSGTFIGERKTLFQNIIPKNQVGVEIGVYKGTLSSFILSTNKPSKLHLIDPWWKYEANWHWAVGDRSSVRSFACLALVLSKEIESQRVEFHIDDSLQVLKNFPINYLDWAYIDSTHEYKQTYDEICAVVEKIKYHGIIAGDDWWRDDVKRAVNEFLEKNSDFKLVFENRGQWAIKRTESS